MFSKKTKDIKILVAIDDDTKASLFIPKLETKGYKVVKFNSFDQVLAIHSKNQNEIIMLTPFGLKGEDIPFYVRQLKRKNPKSIIIIYEGDKFLFIFRRERENDLPLDEFFKDKLESLFDIEFVDYYIWSEFHPIQAPLRAFLHNIKAYYLPELLNKIKNRKPVAKTYMDKFNQIEGMKQFQKYYEVMNKNGTTEDVHPKGFGRFGFDVTNPIPSNNVFGSLAYLKRLRDKDGNPIKYNRLGSTGADNIEHPIDKYKITDLNDSDLGIIYISPYQKTISRKAPEGFLMSQ